MIIPGTGKVVIKMIPIPERKGGLVVPVSQRDKPMEATVIKIAEGEKYFFDEGDMIICNRHSGIEIDGFKLIDYYDIYAKITEDGN